MFRQRGPAWEDISEEISLAQARARSSFTIRTPGWWPEETTRRWVLIHDAPPHAVMIIYANGAQVEFKPRSRAPAFALDEDPSRVGGHPALVIEADPAQVLSYREVTFDVRTAVAWWDGDVMYSLRTSFDRSTTLRIADSMTD